MTFEKSSLCIFLCSDYILCATTLFNIAVTTARSACFMPKSWSFLYVGVVIAVHRGRQSRPKACPTTNLACACILRKSFNIASIVRESIALCLRNKKKLAYVAPTMTKNYIVCNLSILLIKLQKLGFIIFLFYYANVLNRIIVFLLLKQYINHKAGFLWYIYFKPVLWVRRY